MKRTRTFTVIFAAMFPVLALAATNGCGNKKDDDTAPTASVAPPPPPPPATASANVMPEEPDAGSDAADASDGAVAKTGTGGAYTSISKCCNALRANAKSAPPEQMPSYMMAAQACEGLKNTPAANMAFAQIRAYLVGAKMPGACQ